MINKSIKELKLGVIGVGMVGGALNKYLEKRNYKAGENLFVYDTGRELGSVEEINKADIVFICVPTPFVKGKGFDLSYVETACEYLEDGKIIVIKSTVVPGTTENLQKKYPKHRFLFNPEFLTEITAEQDMDYPDRQIVGYTEQSHNVAGDIMQILPLAPFESIIPSTEAELVKYFGNTWFAVKVTFANQMYNLCEKLGVDYDRVKESAAADKRIGRSHLQVIHKGYKGFGGKCLVKDIRALIEFADKEGVDLKLHKMTEDLNNKLMEEQGIEDPEKFSKRD